MPNRTNGWGRLLGTAALALVLYELNVLFFLFLVPLQVILVRRGKGPYAAAAGLTLVGIALLSLWRTSGLSSPGERVLLDLTEVVASGLFMVGIFLVTGGGGQRRLFRMLISSGIAGLVSLPLLFALAESKGFAELIHSQVQAVVTLMKGSFAGGTAPARIDSLLNVDRLTVLVRQVVLSNFLFGYFVVLAGSWRLASVFTYRVQSSRPHPLSEFVVPEVLLWPVLVSWALVAAERISGISVLGYIGWNLGMIGAFLYALQGIGIVQFWLARYRVSMGLRFILAAGIVLLLVWPPTGILVVVALPVLGISELWVRYRRGQAGQAEE